MNKPYHHLSIALFVGLLLASCTSFQEITTDGMVEEDYGKRTRGVVVEDRNIESKASINIKRHKAIPEQANINVKSFNRIVLLTGQVPDQASRQQAASIAQQVRHVRSVHNELETGQPISFMTRSNDTLIATKVRARLMATDDVDSGRVEMVVENGAVFFMGLVTRAESERVINAAKQVSGIRKIVKVFEYIDNN